VWLRSYTDGAMSSDLGKLSPLLALYFAQGLPFGFQATAFPLLLRERGVSLESIGLASLLSVPWLAKALWAPLVDRYGSTRFGRRKSWIVPMQAALCLCALLAAQTSEPTALAALLLLMNLCAATQDIAVDGLAVSWLDPKQLGPANALQVVGYKLGMLTGGGLLVWVSAKIGWSGLFYALAALMALVMLGSLALREPAQTRGGSQPVAFRALLVKLRQALAQPASAALIVVVLSYKSGESLADAMWKPMLLDRGFSSAQIGLWAGTFGLLASLLGSAGSGLWLRHTPLVRVLFVSALLRAASVAGEWWISALATPSPGAVIAITCFEHLAGGAITTVMFALMMRHTDRHIGATHYTLLASLEVWGKLPLSALSGVLAARLGYQALFGISSALCVLFVLLVHGWRGRLAHGN
jgi:MFS transporter, PAT family, beta-lactamase induction signal transducer AmpG